MRRWRRNWRPTQPGAWVGGGGGAYLAMAHQQTKNWCVGLFFPPPAYAGIRPTLFLFRFRADALNSGFFFNSEKTTGHAGGVSCKGLLRGLLQGPSARVSRPPPGRSGQWAPERPAPQPKIARFRVTNNLGIHRRSSSSKQWCE